MAQSMPVGQYSATFKIYYLQRIRYVTPLKSVFSYVNRSKGYEGAGLALSSVISDYWVVSNSGEGQVLLDL